MINSGGVARVTRRDESQAATRAKLLRAARKLFARDGYSVTSLEKIAQEAGFSKGAIYSNFKGKGEVFHAVLEAQGRHNIEPLLKAIRDSRSGEDAIEITARWADQNSRDGSWSMLVIDHARHGDQIGFNETEQSFFQLNWRVLGEALLDRFPRRDLEPEKLGAVVFALIFAPAMTFISEPTPGEIVRTALRAMLIPAS